MDNLNSPEYLEKIKISVIENIRRTGKPSGEQINIPGEMHDDEEDAADDEDADLNADVRITQRQRDQHIDRDDEFESDNEMEEETSGLVRAHKKPRILDGINPLAQPGPEDGDLPDADDQVDVTMSGANGHANDDAEVDDEQNGNGALGDEESARSESAAASPISPTADVEDDEAGDRMDIDDEADEVEDIAQSREEPSTAQATATESVAPVKSAPSPQTSPTPLPASETVPDIKTASTVTEGVSSATEQNTEADVDMTGTGDASEKVDDKAPASPSSHTSGKSPVADTKPSV
jgi:histone deacetylase 1/2